MKSLVVFDSGFGNTRTIAEVIAKTLDGVSKHVSDATEQDIETCDLLIVGSPINGWMPTALTRSFLAGLKGTSLKGKCVTSFDTRVQIFFHGDAMMKIKSKLVGLGGKLIVPPISFFVSGTEGPLLDGELKKAEAWANTIKQEFKKVKGE